jgi:hypothetical protein
MLQNLISPKLGLGLIKYEIQKQMKLKIKDFSIYYVKAYSNLKFKIIDTEGNKHELPFIDEGDKLAKIIKLSISTQLNKEMDIDAFVLSYINKQVHTEIYFKNEDGIKKFMELNL